MNMHWKRNNYSPLLLPPSGESTRERLRLSGLLNKVQELRASRNSVEVTQLAETTFNNLKASCFNLYHGLHAI